jgi:hypothetical protein
VSERGWRDPDLPDGVVRFPPEPPPLRRRRSSLAILVALLTAALAGWLMVR